MEDQIKALQDQLTAQNDTIAKLTSLISEAKTTELVVKEAEKLTIPKDLVEVGKKKYKWSVPVFKLPGSTESITAEEAGTDDEIIKKILAIEGQGLLIEQV